MKSIFSSIILIVFLIQFGFSQNDTIFYDKEWNVLENKDSASFYGFVKYDEEKEVYIQTDYFLSGQLQMEGEYISIKPEVKHGNFVWYNEDGSIKSKEEYEEGENVFRIIDDMPEFPGGDYAMQKYIAQNVKYPMLAVENGIQGKVYIRFVVDKEGNIDNIEVVKSVHSSIDKEAVRVVKNMPKWKPGNLNGKPVKVYYNLPINFLLK